MARRSTHTGINRLVVGLGRGDVLAGISYARSRLALANILDTAASDHRECFVVGPPPLPEADPDATAQLSQAAEEVCLRRNVPYVDAFEPLRNTTTRRRVMLEPPQSLCTLCLACCRC